MSDGRAVSLAFAAYCAIVAPSLCAAQEQSPLRPRANLIMLADSTERFDGGAQLLQILTQRLPIAVEWGRFATDEGISNVCIQARRDSRARSAQDLPDALPFCRMVAVVVDGVTIGKPGDYLPTLHARDLYSIELVSSAEARLRYGTGNSALLVLQTRRANVRR